MEARPLSLRSRSSAGLLCIVALGSLPVVLTGCGGGGGSVPSITALSSSTSAVAGQTVTLSVTADGTNTYQWYKDNTALSGQTSAALALTNVATTDSGTYFVTVTNSNGTTTSQNITLTVTASTGSSTVTID